MLAQNNGSIIFEIQETAVSMSYLATPYPSLYDLLWGGKVLSLDDDLVLIHGD
jgi:hypothetical protein